MNDTRPPLLSISDLKIHFQLDEGIVRAVDGVDFQVGAGQTVAIVGESGCGKSMIAYSLLGLVPLPGRIVAGKILFRRSSAIDESKVVDVAQLPVYGKEMLAIRGAEIAMIFQEPMASFSPLHTIGNQIVEAIRLHRQEKPKNARRLAIEIMKETGIPSPESRIDYYPHQLSGGLLQRAMIAMALSCEPKILIADEPTTALDVISQAQIIALLQKLQHKHNMAVIFVTHDLGIVEQIADVVIVMYLGKIVEKGSVEQIFRYPAHPYTQALLACRISPHVSQEQRLESLSGDLPHPLSLPSGCLFHPRCKQRVNGQCDQHEPLLLSLPTAQNVACFLHHPPGE